MATVKHFNNYVVRIHGEINSRSGILLCYDNNSFVGRIDFYPDGANIPQDYLWHPNPTGESVVLQMPMSQFESVMSMVRVEKPLHLYISSDRGFGASTSGYGHLANTGKEPVGEEEGTS